MRYINYKEMIASQKNHRVNYSNRVFSSHVDQFASKDFNLNEFGHIQNCINQYIRAETDKERQQLLQAIQVLEPDNSNVGKSVDDIIREVVPKTVQEPSEIDRYVDYLRTVGALDHLQSEDAVVSGKSTDSGDKINFSSSDSPADSASE